MSCTEHSLINRAFFDESSRIATLVSFHPPLISGCIVRRRWKAQAALQSVDGSTERSRRSGRLDFLSSGANSLSSSSSWSPTACSRRSWLDLDFPKKDENSEPSLPTDAASPLDENLVQSPLSQRYKDCSTVERIRPSDKETDGSKEPPSFPHSSRKDQQIRSCSQKSVSKPEFPITSSREKYVPNLRYQTVTSSRTQSSKRPPQEHEYFRLV